MALLFQLTHALAHGFGAFWVRWPRKVAKLEAEKAWKQVVTPEDEPAIQAALDWQVPVFEQRDPERVPHAATWLRGRRWEDEQPAPPKPKPTEFQQRVLASAPSRPVSAPSAEWLETARRNREEWGK